MARCTAIRFLLGGMALALPLAAAFPAAADDLGEQQWDEVQGLLSQAIGEDQLGAVVAQPLDTAWQRIEPDLPSEDELTKQQKSEKEQIESGQINYLVEIPPEQREPGGPTHRIVTAPAPFGGTDNMTGLLTGEAGLGSQIESALVENVGSGDFMQDGLGGGMQAGSLGGMLTDGLAGLSQ